MPAPASMEDLVSHLSVSPYVRLASADGTVRMLKFVSADGPYLYWHDKQKKEVSTYVGQTPSATVAFTEEGFTVTPPDSGQEERFAYLPDDAAPNL